MEPKYLHFMIRTIPRNRIPFRRKQIKIMKNVIAIIKNAWGDSPPPKVKTGFILNIIGLTAFLCLSGATAHAQSDKQIINMDNPDYHIDVERFCSPFIDFDNPEEYNSKEVNYRYVKYTQNMNTLYKYGQSRYQESNFL